MAEDRRNSHHVLLKQDILMPAQNLCDNLILPGGKSGKFLSKSRQVCSHVQEPHHVRECITPFMPEFWTHRHRASLRLIRPTLCFSVQGIPSSPKLCPLPPSATHNLDCPFLGPTLSRESRQCSVGPPCVIQGHLRAVTQLISHFIQKIQCIISYLEMEFNIDGICLHTQFLKIQIIH